MVRLLNLAIVVRSLLLMATACLGTATGADPVRSVEAILGDTLLTQAAAWNRGDLAAFMDSYWRSDELTFSTGGQTRRGWQATFDRYRERYPTRERMGQLTFDQLEYHRLADEAYLVLGRWKLERETDPLAGSFTLVFRHIDGRWLIVHDHTSRDAAP